MSEFAKIDSAVERARARFEKVRVTGGVDKDDVNELERLVGNRLPKDYSHFLSQYGTIGFYGLEIYGLIRDNLKGEGPPNAYYMTSSDYKDNSIPLGTIVVYSTGYGPIYLIDCREILETPFRVYGWNYTGDIDTDLPAFETFSDFFEFIIDETLERLANDTGT